jgi:hypothetical protein
MNNPSKFRFWVRLPVILLAATLGSSGQVPDSPPPAPSPAAPAAAPSSAGAQAGGAAPGAAAPASAAAKPGGTGQPGFLGKDVPALDPGTEILTWDGKNWNVNNNRLFAARFEKYLNAPEATSEQDRQYGQIISEILTRLSPGNASKENIDYSFRLLMRGSNYDVDARLCDGLADAVYTVWMAQRQQQRLAAANNAMQYEVKSLQAESAWQSKAVRAGQQADEMHSRRASPRKPNTPPPTATELATEAKEAATEANDWKGRRLLEIVARQKANDVKRELSEIQAKVEYQALIIQFFLQRRFQHVLMGTRFYRAIFADGDTKLNVSDETKQLFSKNVGFAPTVSTLDTLANEALRDVREGVKAFDFLLSNSELESASKRLAEAFTVGEYLPEIRTLPREKKRKCVEFVHKSNELITKMEVKDFTNAEKLVGELATLAKDFDASRPKAIIETARQASRLHLAKARNAALSGEKETLEKEIVAAAELWPLNPELADVSQRIFDQGDVQQRALTELDQLIQQHNYRRIYDDSGRFIAAAAQDPPRQKKLETVLQNMKKIEGAILRAEEMRRQNNYPGAWESVEKAAGEFPDDSKLNQLRADLTTQSADFVRTLRAAQELEKKEQIGAALSHYLKAQKIYPASDFATDGINRVKKAILPES